LRKGVSWGRAESDALVKKMLSWWRAELEKGCAGGKRGLLSDLWSEEGGHNEYLRAWIVHGTAVSTYTF
jgi:hypothetical protein